MVQKLDMNLIKVIDRLTSEQRKQLQGYLQSLEKPNQYDNEAILSEDELDMLFELQCAENNSTSSSRGNKRKTTK